MAMSPPPVERGIARPRRAEIGVRRALILFGRALRLRCPACSGGPMLQSWLKLRPACPRCGLRTERGEGDYFIGANLFNLVAAELLFAAVLAIVLVTTWPNPPWGFLEYGSAVLVILAPIALYPFSKMIWLAADVMMRPLTPEEMRWHLEHGDESVLLPHR
jgi:uncharacterized protein (DUF983 family)